MIEIKNCTVCNIENAIRGMRNPLDSWDKSDSEFMDGHFKLGTNDLKLARKLCAAGSDHRKFLRQIFVSMDITAPLYWWKEFDTYKVGTVSNSTSTMHTIHKKEINETLFSCEKLDDSNLLLLFTATKGLRKKLVNRSCPQNELFMLNSQPFRTVIHQRTEGNYFIGDFI